MLAVHGLAGPRGVPDTVAAGVDRHVVDAPTAVEEDQVARCRSEALTWRAAPAWAEDVRGRCRPTFAYTQRVKPEQSKALGPLAP